MPSSSPTAARGRADDQALRLAWGAWTELGVSGWTRTHADWAIDLEPLLVFTASLGDLDPRLRDEVTDWCALNWRLVSKARLKNLLPTHPDPTRLAFGEFAATVGAHAGVTWPGATQARPFTRTLRSSMPDLTRPSAVWLRVRAMFGIGARAEIIRVLLSAPLGPLGIARIAEASGYTKRNVADECENLERAGLLARRLQGNRFDYTLARRAELEAFIGELPPTTPGWSALLKVTQELTALQAHETNPGTRAIHAKATLNAISDDLATLGVTPPSPSLRGPDLWTWTHALTDRTLGAWSSGQWPNSTGDQAPTSGVHAARS